MSNNAEAEVLDEALNELQTQQEPTTPDESSSQPVTTEGGTDEGSQAETTAEAEPLDESLFEKPKEEAKKPQVSEEQKAIDRERVKQATIENAIKKTVSEDGAIDEEKFAKLPEWVQKEINLQFEAPPEEPKTDAKEAARQVLLEEKDEQQFNELKNSLNGKLTKPQQEALAAKYHKFTKLGMMKGEAMKEAMDGIGLQTTEAIERAKQIGYQRGQAAFPQDAQSPQKEVSLDQKEVKDMTDDEVIKMVKAWG